MRIIDISPTISKDMAVFPGDTPFQRDIAMAFHSGDHLGLSSMRATLHLGAHTDAPNHYHPEGEDIAHRDLSLYLGLSQVISLTELSAAARIQPEDLQGLDIQAPRVLFKTNSFPDPNHWQDDFNSVLPELIHMLADQGVQLVGIDTPSIDPAQARVLRAHLAIFERDMAILEGIVLDKVADGLYQLIALPLKIKGADASPVRAVLIENTQ